MKLKVERISSDIQREISVILSMLTKDPLLKEVTVTAVKTSNDLGVSQIYYTTLNEDLEKTQIALEKAKGFIRKNLSDKLDIRHTPDLKFIFDESIGYAQNIEKIIKEINE